MSNDAVNFLNSAVRPQDHPVFFAGIGIFIGVIALNGMMDIARHGIYQPEHFTLQKSCILFSVMLTDAVPAGRIQFNGNAYLHHRSIPRLRAAGRNLRPLPHQSP